MTHEIVEILTRIGYRQAEMIRQYILSLERDIQDWRAMVEKSEAEVCRLRQELEEPRSLPRYKE